MNSLGKEYRSLLKAEESLRSLDRCLRLAERAAGLRVTVREMTRPAESQAGKEQLHGFVAEITPEGGAPRGAAHEDVEFLSFKTQDPRRTARAIRVGVVLKVLPRITQEKAVAVPEDRYALFMDSCMLVFHQSYFALLPTLADKHEAAARGFLLASFREFARFLDRAADRFTVLALALEGAGEVDRASRYYREAFLATHSDEEDFISRLQTCWTFMIERGELKEALGLLLDTYPTVARKDLDEVKELIETTFELSSQRRVAAGR